MTKIADATTSLAQKKCAPCQGEIRQLDQNDVHEYLKKMDGWKYEDKAIAKTFEFENYYQTVAFVNAVAWIANREDHHPEIELSYKRCRVAFMTHAIEGISENDFIAAAKVDCLIADQ